jgi:cytoskeletal protein RodZ
LLNAEEESLMMLHNKQKVTCYTLIIVAVTILMLGYSSVSAFPFQTTTINHHKIFGKKQASSSSSGADSSSSRSSDTKGSDNSNDNNNNKKNNNQGTNDDSDTSPDDNLQSAETDQQQGTGESVAPTGTATPTPQATCEQGSNCTDQQGLSDHDRSPTDSAAATTQDNNTPFILSVPFP